MKKSLISKGFLLAGIINIVGTLAFTRFFTNDVVFQTDPWVMSSFGMGMIMIWGLVYIAVAKDYGKVPWLVGVFFLEKMAYVVAWLNWLSHNELTPVYEQDMMAGIFYSIYGMNDLLFMIFFGMVFIQLRRAGTSSRNHK